MAAVNVFVVDVEIKPAVEHGNSGFRGLCWTLAHHVTADNYAGSVARELRLRHSELCCGCSDHHFRLYSCDRRIRAASVHDISLINTVLRYQGHRFPYVSGTTY